MVDEDGGAAMSTHVVAELGDKSPRDSLKYCLYLLLIFCLE